MVFFENLLWLLVLIGVMILIHELGHFWAARFFDVRVEVFSFGFGPRLFGFRRGDTDYRFSAILFGGYVKMMGEQAGDEATEDPRSFLGKPRWQRLIVAFAGPLMNILLSVGLLTGLYMVKFQKLAEPPVRGVIGHVIPNSAADKAGMREGDRIAAIEGEDNPTWEEVMMKEVASAYRTLNITVEREGKRFPAMVTPVLEEKLGVGCAGWSEKTEVEIGSVSPGMPAEKAGLRKGDLLVSVNGRPIHARLRLRDLIQTTKGEPAAIEYERDGQRRTVTLRAVLNNNEGQNLWMIGVAPDARLKIVTTQLGLPEALAEAVRQNRKGAQMIVGFLKGIVERRMSAKQLQGPIGIAQLSGEAAREGPSAFIHLMSMVSLNLAIFNLLPIPILDGGVILLLLVEIVIRRDLSMPVKEAVIKVGFVFLMVVTVFALYNDISRILPG
ncbi:MAG: RIP metalloprotease RseP [Candidatus Solibacter usitatus]|nr:RIP metalloprotease RseP [Candidatus Solibacter usitatus]